MSSAEDIVVLLNGCAQQGMGALWRACWQGGLFVLGVWIVCRLLPRLPAATRYGLWWLACLKLVISLICAAAIPLPLLPPAAEPPMRRAAHVWAEQSVQGRKKTAEHTRGGEAGASALPPGKEAAERRLPRPDADNSGLAPVLRPAPRLSVSTFLLAFWLAGVAVAGVSFFRRCMALQRIVRGARSLADGDVLAQEMACLAAGMGLRRAPRLVASGSVTTPLVIGPVRPVLVFPENLLTMLSPDEWRLALAHELAHVRRGDLWLGLLPAIAQSMFFFFPRQGWLRASRPSRAKRPPICPPWGLRACPPRGTGSFCCE